MRQANQRAAESEEREYHLKVECKRPEVSEGGILALYFLHVVRMQTACSDDPIVSASFERKLFLYVFAVF
jgi:hypothetical protein